MHRLLYKSILSDGVRWAEMVAIAKQSRISNHRRSICGMLIFSGDRVLQVLEGELEPLNQLFEKISQDSRHHSIELLEFKPVNTNLFGKWKMKDVNLDQLSVETRKAIEHLLQNNVDSNTNIFPDDPASALAILSTLATQTSDRLLEAYNEKRTTAGYGGL